MIKECFHLVDQCSPIDQEDSDTAAPLRYDITKFPLSDVVRCGQFIREVAKDACSMQEAADAIVQHFYSTFRDPTSGERSIALVRFFKTHPFSMLSDPLQEVARRGADGRQLADSTKCLTLLASAGDKAEWNSCQASRGHRAIPLFDEQVVSDIPMVSQLIRQLGIEPSSVINPVEEIRAQLDARSYDVFHVEEAVGSPYIPAQDDFVKPYGIRSVLGFGSMLPTGNLFAVLIFAKAPISAETANTFRTLALKTKTAILRFEERSVFEDAAGVLDDDSPDGVDAQCPHWQSVTTALKELETVYDRMVVRQARRLESAVREAAKANMKLRQEIEQRKLAEQQRETLHQQLLMAYRQAGMAEVATGVLHNVGNALNGVNLSATMLSDLTRRSRLGLLRSVSVLIDEHADNLPVFLTSDKRGQQLPTFLRHLADALEQERATLRSEVEAIVENVDHLKAIVRAQQSYSACCGVTECVMICSVVDDALKLVGPSLARHGIEVIRRYADTPLMTLDKQKLLQILVNLIKNAKEAILELPGCSATITLSTEVIADRGVFIQVSDSGIGIAQEGLAEIFRHGYTTKKTRGGNGFGLHHSALAARELGGSLTARSEGINQGAVFTLELPFSAVEQFEE